MAKLSRFFILLLFPVLIISCEKQKKSKENDSNTTELIRAMDISMYPVLEERDMVFNNQAGVETPFLEILKESGVNTIRLKIWVDPDDETYSLNEVTDFAIRLKSLGFKIWLTVHYSDSWADPGQQVIPANWADLSFADLKTTMYDYTRQIAENIQPDIIQIGNEMNNGLLHPEGNLSDHPQQLLELMQAGISAVRTYSSSAEIMIHYAGIDGAEWFFDQVKTLDYDLIGLSYYPIWHGKDLNELEDALGVLSEAHDKKVLIAETAYPFTFDWNDWTNNIIGTDEQIISALFPATYQGQKAYIKEIRSIVEKTNNATGFCYWGAERVAFDGSQSANGSAWENQAVFDFNNRALPVLDAFSKE